MKHRGETRVRNINTHNRRNQITAKGGTHAEEKLTERGPRLRIRQQPGSITHEQTQQLDQL